MRETPSGLVCVCPDHKYRKADCEHIKVILEVVHKNKGYMNEAFRITEKSKLNLCKLCDLGNLIKKGIKRNKTGEMQMFKCKDCKRRFTTNFDFERKQFDEGTITGAMQMYFTGMSVRDIANHYEMMGIDACHRTIYNWIDQYSKMIAEYLNGIVPRVGNWFRADEVWVKIAG